MIIPKIDGGIPTIVYNNDENGNNLPISVYANGERQSSLSATATSANGNGEIDDIFTEYDKSKFFLSLQGTSLNGENANDNGITISFHTTNLATAQQIYRGLNGYLETEFDGRNCIRYKCAPSVRRVIDGGFKENTQYTVSGDYYSVIAEGNGDASFVIFFYYTDGTSEFKTLSIRNEWIKFVSTSKAGKTLSAIGMNNAGYMTYIYVDVNTFQINEGTQVLPYEPYIRRAVNIPTSIEIEGNTVLLPFSNGTALYIDGVTNEVIYNSLQGSANISTTTLGKNLLNLHPIRNYKNILEVNSNGNAPPVPLVLSYFIWEGRNENINNA